MPDPRTLWHRAQARCAEMHGPEGICQTCFRTEVFEALQQEYPEVPGTELLDVIGAWQRAALEPWLEH